MTEQNWQKFHQDCKSQSCSPVPLSTNVPSWTSPSALVLPSLQALAWRGGGHFPRPLPLSQSCPFLISSHFQPLPPPKLCLDANESPWTLAKAEQPSERQCGNPETLVLRSGMDTRHHLGQPTMAHLGSQRPRKVAHWPRAIGWERQRTLGLHQISKIGNIFVMPSLLLLSFWVKRKWDFWNRIIIGILVRES